MTVDTFMTIYKNLPETDCIYLHIDLKRSSGPVKIKTQRSTIGFLTDSKEEIASVICFVPMFDGSSLLGDFKNGCPVYIDCENIICISLNEKLTGNQSTENNPSLDVMSEQQTKFLNGEAASPAEEINIEADPVAENPTSDEYDETYDEDDSGADSDPYYDDDEIYPDDEEPDGL